MRIRRVFLGFGLVAVVLGGAAVGAQNGDPTEGRTLYFDNCSGCHGLVLPESGQGSPGPAFIRVALVVSPAVTLTDVAPGLDSHGVPLPRGIQRAGRLRLGSGERMAIAPPYGPTLRGVIGRTAGSVPGFLYSSEFRAVMRGVVWTPGTLDAWIADSQAWVPGSFMFYRQPHAEKRRKIVGYLEATGTSR